MKNCDLGLENAARGRAAFSRPRSQFFTIRTDLSWEITFFSPLSQTTLFTHGKKLTQALLSPWSEIGKSGPR